jgi:hypothetical protein
MAQYTYRFVFLEEDSRRVKGSLELMDPLPYEHPQGEGIYRTAKITLEEGGNIDLVLYHNQATATFMYIRNAPFDQYLLDIVGFSAEEISQVNSLALPGQLCLGSQRTQWIGQAGRPLP